MGMDSSQTVDLHVSSALGIVPGTTIATAPGQPNAVAVVVPWWQISLARGLDAFLTCLLGGGTLGGITGLIPAKDFLHLVINASMLSLGPAVIAVLYDAQKQLRKFLQAHQTDN